MPSGALRPDGSSITRCGVYGGATLIPTARLAADDRPIRHRALGLLLGAALVLAAGVAGPLPRPPARGPRGRRGRRPISASFVMHGHIATAVRVRGEHRGQAVDRRWTFSGLSCAGSVCPRLSLRRQRSAHHFDRLTLSRVGIGSYAGRGRFYAALRCRGRLSSGAWWSPTGSPCRWPRWSRSRGSPSPAGSTATYTNLRRIDRTRCPIGPSHDAAQYTGRRRRCPGPPAAAFSVAVHPVRRQRHRSPTHPPRAPAARGSCRACGSSAIRPRAPADTATTPHGRAHLLRRRAPIRCRSASPTPTG